MDRAARWWLFGPAVAWLALSAVGLWLAATDEAAWSAVDRGTSEAVGSSRCLACHPAQHATWSASYHRTMTQSAQGDAVLAPFAGESLEALGFVATMTGGHDAPHVRIERVDAEPSAEPTAAPTVLDVDVELTVGSHRYQQYVARIDRGGGRLERWRLPVAWHVELGRWVHVNDAFLTPQGAWGSEADYLRHLSRWNDNCIFCHNTEPVPGLRADGRFETTTAELGIGCEACHGAASAHVARHRSPLRRLLALGEPGGDRSVAHPGALGPALAADVCGRCHGNRIAADIARVLREGDGFVPGHPLSTVSRPIERDATVGGQPGAPFAERFWSDGTPRLSAYEYQALRASPCHQDGQGLGCGDCHTMHGPEPSMQLWPGYDTERVCEGCHAAASLSDADAAGGHGRHGESITCGDCHMPRITYGLLEGMLSHRISSPRPRADMPDACTQCHVERTRGWAEAALAQWPGTMADDRSAEPSRVLEDLLGGDPIERALAAHALTRPTVPTDETRRMAWLVDALADDYPAIRWFGFRGLRTLAERADDETVLALLADDRVMDDPGRTAMLIDQLRVHLGPGGLDHRPEQKQRLLDQRDDQAIWIGE